ncbi:MAG: SRPBCC domain-containing protein [Hyphomicrobiaceae bacterium]
MSTLATWDMRREIVLSRVIAAAPDMVQKAWTEARHIVRWFGPDGFQLETADIDIRPGGMWRFGLTAPDGTAYDNRIVFIAVEPTLIVFEHGPDQDEAPERFRVTVTLDAQDDGRTVLTLRQLHPTIEQRDATVGFGAVELGYQTLDKLAAYVAGR